MATFSDLPAEVLEEVLEYSDSINLVCRIAKVNRTLKYVALNNFLRRSGIIRSSCIDVRYPFTLVALHVLCAAVWIKDVRKLTIRFDKGPTIIHEVWSLTRFIHQLDSLGALDLYIPEDKFGFPNLPIDEQAELGNAWQTLFSALLMAALSKGVDRVHVFGPASGMLPRCAGMGFAPPLPKY